MNSQAVTPPDRIISSVAKYYQEIQFAENVLDLGIDDLIVLIYGEKIDLGNVASISNEPPAIQRAVCEIARIHNEKISLRDTAREVKSTWLSQEWRPETPFAIDDSKLAAHFADMEKAAKIKAQAMPEVLVVLDQGWVVMDAAVILSSQKQVVQEITCKLLWNGNTNGKRLSLDDALVRAREALSADDE